MVARQLARSQPLTQREDDADLVVPDIQLRYRLLDIGCALLSVRRTILLLEPTQAAPEKLWLPM